MELDPQSPISPHPNTPDQLQFSIFLQEPSPITMIDTQKQKVVVGDGSKPRRGRPPGSRNRMKTINASSSSNQSKRHTIEQGALVIESQPRTGEITKRRRGRPKTKNVAKADTEGFGVPVTGGRKKRTCKREDVCFICKEDDGGSVVFCNRPMCPKVYHYDCTHYNDQFPPQKDQASCGWHFCSFCDKAAQSMCYTCTFSVCGLCIKQAKFVCVRGNKGFCETCMELILLIETKGLGNTDLVRKSFAEKNSFEYLFKVYWKALQGKISLTLDEVTRVRNLLKESPVVWESTELISPWKGLSGSYDTWSIGSTYSTNASEPVRSISDEGSCDMEHFGVNESSLNQESDAGASNGDAVVGSGSFLESAVAYMGDEEKIWHHRDESGEIIGPFSIAQLDHWCTKCYFRANLRIWRATEKEEDSILLMDALNGKFHKESPQGIPNNSFQSPKSDDAVLVPRSGQITVSPTHVPVKANGGLANFEDSYTPEPNTQATFLDSQNKSGAYFATGAQASAKEEPRDICDSISVEIPDIVSELPARASGVRLKVDTDLVTENFPSELVNLSGSICFSSSGGSECQKENREWFSNSVKKPETIPRLGSESQGCESYPSQKQNSPSSSVTTHHGVEKQPQDQSGDNLLYISNSDASSTIADQPRNVCSPLLTSASVSSGNRVSINCNDAENKAGAHISMDALVDAEPEPCYISTSISVEIPGIVAELPASTVGVPPKVCADLVSETVPPEIVNPSDSICLSSGGGSKCPKENQEWCCDTAMKTETNSRPGLEPQRWELDPFRKHKRPTSGVTTHYAVRKQSQGHLGGNLLSVSNSAVSSTIVRPGNLCRPLLPSASLPSGNHASILIAKYGSARNITNNVSDRPHMQSSMPSSATWGMGSGQNPPSRWEPLAENNAGWVHAQENASMNFNGGSRKLCSGVSSQASIIGSRTTQENYAVRKQAHVNLGRNLSYVSNCAAYSRIANRSGNVCSPFLRSASVPSGNRASMLIVKYGYVGNTENNVSAPIFDEVQEARPYMPSSMPAAASWGMGSGQNAPYSLGPFPEQANISKNFDGGLTHASSVISPQATTIGDRFNVHQNKRFCGGYSGHSNGGQAGSYGLGGQQGVQRFICRHYLRGCCHYEQRCLFLHPARKTTPQD